VNAASLLASLFISTVGYAVFIYGKRQQRAPQLAIGIALMGFPYFVDSALWMFAIAGALLLTLWLLVRY
jgi:uncharacterized membrane protein